MEATTKEGKKVLLHSDGRWEYISANSPTEGRKIAFRNASWGDSKSTVKNSEKAHLQSDENNYLWYASSVGTHPCTVLYVFAEDKLIRTKYILTEEHSNLNRYIDSFFDLKNNLEKKYGKPNLDDVMWHNDLYQDDQQQWGFAISMGHLSVYTEWNTAETLVNIAINGENNNIMVSVEYISKKLIHIERDQLEQSVLSDL